MASLDIIDAGAKLVREWEDSDEPDARVLVRAILALLGASDNLPPDVSAALDRFIATQEPAMSRAEAMLLLIRDGLIGAGYLDAPPEEE